MPVRSARTEDIDAIFAIIADALDPEDADEARMVLTDPHFDRDRWLVATADPAGGDDTAGAALSTMALLDADLRLGSVTVPIGQIEFVATSDAAQGQGLVRRQISEAHLRSEAAGHLAQIIVGIPHFYRQFGYSYAVRTPAYHTIGETQGLIGDAAWAAHPATVDDLDAVVATQRKLLAGAELAVSHTHDMWRWLLLSPNYEVVMATSRGRTALGRIYADDDTAWLGDVAAPTKGALHGLIAAARQIAPEVVVLHNTAPATVRMLDEIGEATDELGWYYTRIASPMAFLDAMRPELGARLAASSLAGTDATFTLSLYRSSLSIEFTAGQPGPVVEGPPVPYPVSAGASGVPMDLFPDLVLGPHGALGLERLHGDVLLGDQRQLMAVLFPSQRPMIQTWVYP